MLVDKYKPQRLEDVISQKTMISSITAWLDNWKPGKALMLYGPSGIGKNLIVELIAKEKGLRLLEINASDKRNAASVKKLIPATKEGSLMGGRLILIDEAENLSVSDRGGSAEMIEIIKKSAHPVIMISQNPYDKKLQTIRRYCDLLKFRKIPKNIMARFLSTVVEKESLGIDSQTIANISENADGDLRSALNDLEMKALGYREREKSIFETLQAIFKGDLNKALEAISLSEKSLDEIFWWVEQNITTEFSSAEDIASAFEILSKANMFRFNKYKKDMIASISTLNSKKGFSMYKPPDMFIILGRTKKKRAEAEEQYEILAKQLHCSKRKVIEQMPYLNMIMK
ncbi:MAG: AAA family ATPase [Candidatus Aenigmatarchaeota archaeon]